MGACRCQRRHRFNASHRHAHKNRLREGCRPAPICRVVTLVLKLCEMVAERLVVEFLLTGAEPTCNCRDMSQIAVAVCCLAIAAALR